MSTREAAERLSVGQKLWFVYRERRGAACEATITKVGRKWAELDIRQRIEIATMDADGRGYSSPGRAYLSQQEWEAEREADESWRELRAKVNNVGKRNLTAEQIKQAAAILGIDLKEPEGASK